MDSGRITAAILLCVYTVFAVRGTFQSASGSSSNSSTYRSASRSTSYIDWERCKCDWQYAKSTRTLQACQTYLDATQDYDTIANWVRCLLRYYCAHPPRQGTKENEIFTDELRYAAEDAGVPQKGYRNVAIFATKAYSSDAPLTIKTDGSASYLVRFYDLNRQEVAMDYYIPAGQTGYLKVPLGSYEIKYVSGHTWYGDELLFGPDSCYSKADRTFSFEYNHEYTLTLYRVKNGNLRTSGISAEDFGLDASLGD